METFDPVKYSREENTFLLENAGKAPIVALNGLSKEGVNPRAVRPVLQEVYDREQLRVHEQVQWAGVEALKERIKDFLELDAKWEKAWISTRGRTPRYPTMYIKDAKGKYHFGASGSDSSHAKHYEKDGVVRAFEFNFDGLDEDGDLGEFSLPTNLKLNHDTEKCRIECPICNHTEHYKVESRSSYNAARARMSKHLKMATDESSLHRELHTVEFGGG